MLYQFRFKPQLRHAPGGGEKLRTLMGKKTGGQPVIRSIELSCNQEHVSTIENGYMKGSAFDEVMDVYGADLLGARLHGQYGGNLPVVVSFLEAGGQGGTASCRDNTCRFWYVVDADPGAAVYIGPGSEMTEKKVRAGDWFLIPPETACRVGAGVLLAEIDRLVEDAQATGPLAGGHYAGGEVETLVKTRALTVNAITLDGMLMRDYADVDTMVGYVCLEGQLISTIENGTTEPLARGQVTVTGAEQTRVRLKGKARLLEFGL